MNSDLISKAIFSFILITKEIFICRNLRELSISIFMDIKEDNPEGYHLSY